jgi:hypothetical protein
MLLCIYGCINNCNESNAITKVFNDKHENEFLFKCPHCDNVRGIEKEDSLRNLGGEQYQDNLCDGWYEISRKATFVETVKDLN